MAEISILVVEDDAAEAALIQAVLQDAGYGNIRWADSSHHALDLHSRCPADVILMDIHLGEGKDGIQTIVEMRKNTSFYVIYLTSLRDQKTFLRAKQTFPEYFLTKPFNSFQLLDMVESVLQSQKTELSVSRDYFFSKTEGSVFYKFEKKQILFLESSGSYTNIHMETGDSLRISKNLKQTFSELECDFLIRISSTTAINFHKIEMLEASNTLFLLGIKEGFIISRLYKDAILKWINKL